MGFIAAVAAVGPPPTKTALFIMEVGALVESWYEVVVVVVVVELEFDLLVVAFFLHFARLFWNQT